MKDSLYEQYRDDPKGLEAHLAELGYKTLGWQVHSGNSSELKACLDLGHFGHDGLEKKRVEDIQHTRTGSNVTYWCSECKNYWKIDMSD